MKRNLLSTVVMLALSLTMFAQGRYDTLPNGLIVDRSVFPDFQLTEGLSKERKDSLMSEFRRKMALRSPQETRPSRVNNAEDIHFPPIFSQDGGSCSCAAMTGYNFTHEINALRGLNGKLEENQYPTHYQWFFSAMWPTILEQAKVHGVPTVPVYGGRTYSSLFGNQSSETKDFGWMQGYDKWYSAMSNRVDEYMEIGNLGNEEDREWLKNWMWNHCGDEDYHSGGVAYFCMGISGFTPAQIPAGSYEAGKTYVKYWGPNFDHAQTLVGYDDNIEIDLNENGTIEDDERGAWIVCNSWGSGFGDNGLIYMPYKYGRYTYNPNTKEWGDWSTFQIMKIRKNYTPKRTLKISMNYSNRSEMSINVGVSQDTTATRPEFKATFPHFNYAKASGTSDVSGKIPMLGRWKDGLHEESMEFGLDVTDLSGKLDMTKPIKYFFTIETKVASDAKGVIDYCALMDYEFDKNGIELPFDRSNVTIENKGKSTTLTLVVSGRPIYPPINVSVEKSADTGLDIDWQAPANSFMKVTSYKIYRDGQELVELPATMTHYNDQSAPAECSYQLSSVYEYGDMTYESPLTDRIFYTLSYEPTSRNAIKFDGGGFKIPNLFNQTLQDFTIEFWAKPTRVRSYNWHIGPGWGTFLFHFIGNYSVSVGYNTGPNRLDGVGRVTANKWTHFAITNKKNKISLYINGKGVTSGTFSAYSGLSNISEFMVGRADASGLEGEIDEFRVWKVARTSDEIALYYNAELPNPEIEPDLLAYYPMDTLADGRIRDAKGGYHATFINKMIEFTDNCSEVTSLEVDPEQSKADFTLAGETYYAGMPIAVSKIVSYGFSSLVWNAPEAGVVNKQLKDPVFIYPEAGDYVVTMIATNGDLKKEVTKNITVQPLPLPIADFEPAYPTAIANDFISFKNKTKGELCEFEWYFEGGNPERATSINAATTYEKSGKYAVKLIARNVSGADTIVKEDVILVAPAVPVSDFELSKYDAVVGEEIQLIDLSKNYPTEWLWTLENESIETYTEQNPVIKFTKPGIYSLSLKASNEAGENTVLKENIITVSAQPSGNALNFDGYDDYVEVTDLFKTEPLQAFTIEWWMYAKENVAEGHQMGADASTILIQSSATGSLRVMLGGEKNLLNVASTSEQPFIKQGEWIHLALVFDDGRLTVYKNGKEITSKKFSGMTEAPAWVNGFNLGTGNGKTLNALIDEFRVWSVARTSIDIVNNLNGPLVAPDKEEGLELYYNFDQNMGNVIDVQGKHEGIRHNFGPDGDAWSTSNAFNVGLDATKIKVTASTENPDMVDIVFNGGMGKKRVIFLRKASNTENAHPADETTYSSVSTMASASESIPGSGYVCIYNGNKETCSIGGLSSLTEYELMIVEYVEINRKPYYFSTSSHARFTTDEIASTKEIVLTDAVSVYQTEEAVHVILPGDKTDHTVAIYQLDGVLIEKAVASGELILSKSSLNEGVYLIRIDDEVVLKVPVVK